MKRWTGVGAFVLGAALAAWLAWPREPQSDEERIRAAIEKVAHAANEKAVVGMLEHVSERYRGEPGDRAQLRQLLFASLQRSDWVRVIPAKLLVHVEGDEARASFVALLIRGPARDESEVRPEDLAGSHAFSVVFEREGDRWLAVDAKRRDAKPADWLR